MLLKQGAALIRSTAYRPKKSVHSSVFASVVLTKKRPSDIERTKGNQKYRRVLRPALSK